MTPKEALMMQPGDLVVFDPVDQHERVLRSAFTSTSSPVTLLPGQAYILSSLTFIGRDQGLLGTYWFPDELPDRALSGTRVIDATLDLENVKECRGELLYCRDFCKVDVHYPDEGSDHTPHNYLVGMTPKNIHDLPLKFYHRYLLQEMRSCGKPSLQEVESELEYVEDEEDYAHAAHNDPRAVPLEERLRGSWSTSRYSDAYRALIIQANQRIDYFEKTIDASRYLETLARQKQKNIDVTYGMAIDTLRNRMVPKTALRFMAEEGYLVKKEFRRAASIGYASLLPVNFLDDLDDL